MEEEQRADRLIGVVRRDDYERLRERGAWIRVEFELAEAIKPNGCREYLFEKEDDGIILQIYGEEADRGKVRSVLIKNLVDIRKEHKKE